MVGKESKSTGNRAQIGRKSTGKSAVNRSEVNDDNEGLASQQPGQPASLNDYLRHRVRSCDHSAYWISQAAGITAAAVSLWLDQKRGLTLHTAERISQAIGLRSLPIKRNRGARSSEGKTSTSLDDYLRHAVHSDGRSIRSISNAAGIPYKTAHGWLNTFARSLSLDHAERLAKSVGLHSLPISHPQTKIKKSTKLS